MMNGKIRRLLAGLMCLVMVVGLLPVTAGAGFVTDGGSIVLEYVGDSYTVPANTAPVYSSSNLNCVYTAGGAVSSITDGNYYLGDGTNYISSDMGVTDDINVAALWTVSTSDSGYTIKLGEKYLAYYTPDSGSAGAILGLSDSSFVWQWSNECNAFFYQASPFEAPGYIYADGSKWALTESVDSIATAYTSGSCTMTYVQGVESQTEVEVTIGETEYKVILAAAVSETALTMDTKPADGTTTGEPFVKGTPTGCNSFRIPAMVTLSDGTIVAAADARWNTTYDGGGLDTIVARSSDNGAKWNYTFANYLGDNDNKYNGSSTCFIDPALAVKTINGVETIFMLVDLYPYGVALNGDQELPPVTDTGFNSSGKLLLSADSHSSYSYYLDKNADGTYTIYSSNGTEVKDYTVDAYFNITGTDGTSSNLFFSDSPYKVVRTGFLYLTKSTDGGKTWSAPELLNLKFSNNSERVCLVGPGRGLVTSAGTIVFPVYTFNSNDSEITTNQQTGFIYSTDDGTNWTRSASLPTNSQISWSSESAVVELTDGTLRFFFRNGTTNLCYVDYDNGWGTPVVMSGVDTNSNCQISAITYSKTYNNKQVILVSCPTGSNGTGSNDSSASARLNGKIFAFTVESDNTLASIGSISVTSDNAQFMYSCMTEVSKTANNADSGDIAILYEDCESNWGTGDNSYYTMSYATYDLATELGVTFDSTDEDNDNDDGDDDTDSNVTITDTVDVRIKVGKTSETYTDTTGNYESTTTNKQPDTTIATMTVVGESGTAAKGKLLSDSSEVDLSDCLFTFTLGTDGYYVIESASVQGAYLNNVMADASATEPISATAGKIGITAGHTNMFQFKFNAVDGSTYNGTPSLHFHSELTTPYWNRCGSDTSTKCYEYLYRQAEAGEASSDEIPGYVLVTSLDEIKSGKNYLIAQTNGTNYYVLYPGTTQFGCVVQVDAESATTTASTTITFNGVSVGETTAIVGSTQYNITVYDDIEITVNYQVDGKTVATGTVTVASDADEASLPATVSDGTNTYIVGNTTLTLREGVTEYNVAVTKAEFVDELSIPVQGSETISVPLTDGQYVEWTCNDDTYAGVMGVYDSTAGAYTNQATVVGLSETATGEFVIVTGTVYNENGTVAGTYKWKVSVTAAAANSYVNSTRYVKLNVGTITDTEVYYSINGGDLIKLNGTGYVVGSEGAFAQYDSGEALNVTFFAAPEEGYALTYMGYTVNSGETPFTQFYSLDGNLPDGTDSAAWPFADGTTPDNIPADSSDAAWKSGHGLRWALLQGNFGIDQLKLMFTKAKALGCQGVTTVTINDRNNTDSSGQWWATFHIYSQKLPEMNKEIVSVTRGETGKAQTSESGDVAYYDGIAVYIGDTINYEVTVYVPYSDIDSDNINDIVFSNIALKDDTLGITALNGVDSWTSVSSGVSAPTATTVGSFEYILNGETVTYSGSTTAYTYTANLTLATDNFTEFVQGGKITNVASLSYDYTTKYYAGEFFASSTAVAAVSVEPAFVVDFGLPIDMNLSDMVESYGTIEKFNNTSVFSESADSTVTFDGAYGSFSWDADTSVLTYTPTSVMLDTEDLLVTLADNAGAYYIAIHPASNVLYEETFMNISDSGHYTDWTQPTTETFKTITVKDANNNDFNIYIDEGGDGEQTAANEAPYGYDAEYVNSTGVSGRSYYANLSGAGAMTENLVVDFYGNCFDLIGTCGPTTGYVYLAIKANDAGGSNQVIIIDTSNSKDTFYQVPLAHVDLTLGNYTAYVFGGYRQVDSKGVSFFGAGAMGANDDLFAMFDRAYEEGLDFGDVEFVYFDESSALASYANSMMMYAADGDTTESDNATQTIAKVAGGIIEIDGFRVYGTSDNGAFAVGEYDVEYKNVLEQANNGFMGYIEGGTGSYGNGNYEDEGGPQNEIYLAAGSSVTFSVNADVNYAQISARAVSGATKMSAITDEDAVEITSNTEMYYKVELVSTTDNDGNVTGKTIVIKNTGNSFLALGNLKLTTENRGYGVQASELTLLSVPTEATYATAFMMLRAYSGEEETETPEEDTGNTEETETPEENNGEEETDVPVIIWPTYTPSQTNVFRPEEFNMEVDSYTLFGQRFVTIKVNASTDVAKLTINGTPLWAANYIWVKQGLADEYVYTMLLIVPENEAAFFEVLAYNEDGLASKVYTITD